MDRSPSRSEVIPLATRAIKTPEQRKRFERAKKKWQQRKAQDFDKWVPLFQEFDPVTGLRYIFEFNCETEQIRWTTKFEYTQALVETNQRQFNDSLNKRFGDVQKVASIPPNMLFQEGWRQAYMENDEQWINRKLNDPDFAKLRTFRGKI